MKELFLKVTHLEDESKNPFNYPDWEGTYPGFYFIKYTGGTANLYPYNLVFIADDLTLNPPAVTCYTEEHAEEYFEWLNLKDNNEMIAKTTEEHLRVAFDKKLQADRETVTNTVNKVSNGLSEDILLKAIAIVQDPSLAKELI